MHVCHRKVGFHGCEVISHSLSGDINILNCIAPGNILKQAQVVLYLHTARIVTQYAHNGPAGSCLAGNGKVIPDGETTGDACSSW